MAALFTVPPPFVNQFSPHDNIRIVKYRSCRLQESGVEDERNGKENHSVYSKPSSDYMFWNSVDHNKRMVVCYVGTRNAL